MKKYIFALAFVAFFVLGQQVLARPSIGCTLTVSPKSVLAGVETPVTVTWTTMGADRNGIIAPFLGGSVSRSGSKTFIVSTPQRYELVALSNSLLWNSIGSDAVCIATVSTFGNPMP